MDDSEEELDPADVDSLDDRTAARRKAKAVSSKAAPLPSEGRLRLRANIPVAEGYEGKAVSRQQVFGAEEDDGDFDDDFDAGPQLDFEAPIAGGLNISGDVEEEYEKLMRSTQAELAVMRQPSAEDVDKKRRSAQELKQQMEGWANLVEARIHLEGPLSIAHRLPCGVVASAFKEDQKLAEQSLLVAKEAQKLLATMLNLQQHLAKDRCSFPPLESSEGRVVLESEAWGMVDGRLRGVLDWALGVADGWKEHTRLDSRRSFKVLDQSLQLQMQAVAETEPEKLRKRCTPPVGKHNIFGVGEANEEAVQDIFDDRDFYVQLLKEVLSGTGISQKDEEKQLLAEIAGRRSQKRKAQKEVERRASKGRKIRYRPIEKLQNFMSGRPRGSLSTDMDESEPLSESACQALLSSLFAPPRA